MNKIGYDALVYTKIHDFNYGYERLIELKEMADFSIIAANVVREDGTRGSRRVYHKRNRWAKNWYIWVNNGRD